MKFLDFMCRDGLGLTHVKIPEECCGTITILKEPFDKKSVTRLKNPCPIHMELYISILQSYKTTWKAQYEASFGGLLNQIVEVKDGCVCRSCNIKNEYAQPNQNDNTYICFNCR